MFGSCSEIRKDELGENYDTKAVDGKNREHVEGAGLVPGNALRAIPLNWLDATDCLQSGHIRHLGMFTFYKPTRCSVYYSYP